MLVNPIYGGGGANFTFSTNGKFCYPENVVIPNTVTSLTGNNNAAFNNHWEPMKISFEAGSTITSIPDQAFRYSGIRELILPPSITSVGGYAWGSCTGLKKLVFNSIPTMAYMSSSAANPFSGTSALEDVQIPPGWTENLYIAANTTSYTKSLTHDSMVAIIANLYDYTGGDAHTLTLGTANLARLSEDEKAVATAKNWSLS